MGPNKYFLRLDNDEVWCYTENDDDGLKLQIALAKLTCKRAGENARGAN